MPMPNGGSLYPAAAASQRGGIAAYVLA